MSTVSPHDPNLHEIRKLITRYCWNQVEIQIPQFDLIGQTHITIDGQDIDVKDESAVEKICCQIMRSASKLFDCLIPVILPSAEDLETYITMITRIEIGSLEIDRLHHIDAVKYMRFSDLIANIIDLYSTYFFHTLRKDIETIRHDNFFICEIPLDKKLNDTAKDMHLILAEWIALRFLRYTESEFSNITKRGKYTFIDDGSDRTIVQQVYYSVLDMSLSAISSLSMQMFTTISPGIPPQVVLDIEKLNVFFDIAYCSRSRIPIPETISPYRLNDYQLFNFLIQLLMKTIVQFNIEIRLLNNQTVIKELRNKYSGLL